MKYGKNKSIEKYSYEKVLLVRKVLGSEDKTVNFILYVK